MKKQYIYAFISIILWATSATVVKLMVTDLTNIQVLAGANFFAVISLLAVTLIQNKVKIVKSYKIKDYINFALLGSLGVFIYYTLYNQAINLMPAIEAYTINYSWPIMIMFFAVIILKEKFNIYKLVALFISFIGVIIIATNGNMLGFSFSNLSGSLMAFGAAISYGLFCVLVKKKNYDNTTLMLFCYFSSFILAIIFLDFKFPSLNMYQVLGFVWLGAFTQGIPYLTWALALKNGDTSKVSNLGFMTPIISSIFTFVILKEHLHLYLLIGFIFILFGIILQSKQKFKNKL